MSVIFKLLWAVIMLLKFCNCCNHISSLWYSTFLEYKNLISGSLLIYLISPQRSGPSWWSSRNVWTSRQRWGSSCCRTSRTSSGRRQRLRWNTPETWRNWPNASWQRLAAPRITSSTSEETLSCSLSVLNLFMMSFLVCWSNLFLKKKVPLLWQPDGSRTGFLCNVDRISMF